MQLHTLITALGDEPLAPLVLARQLDARRVVCVGRPIVEWRVPALLAVLRREGREATWLPIQTADVPAGLAQLSRRLHLDPDDAVVFDLTNTTTGVHALPDQVQSDPLEDVAMAALDAGLEAICRRKRARATFRLLSAVSMFAS